MESMVKMGVRRLEAEVKGNLSLCFIGPFQGVK